MIIVYLRLMLCFCSYLVSLGILDKLSQYLANIRGPVDNDSMVVADFLLHALALINAIIRLTACRYVAHM